MLSWNLLLRGRCVSTVLSIVQDAAHARMRYLPTPTGERVAYMERICMGAELAFVSRLPGKRVNLGGQALNELGAGTM